MTSAVVFAAIWIGMGTVIAFLPRKYHPPSALMLLVLLVPLIPYLWIAGNTFLAVMFVAGVGSILRWPLFYISRMLLRWVGIRIERDRFETSGYKMDGVKASERGS